MGVPDCAMGGCGSLQAFASRFEVCYNSICKWELGLIPGGANNTPYHPGRRKGGDRDAN